MRYNMLPIKFSFAVEKSMYRGISERMLQLFASVEELNNLIGDPVNRYRHSYKNMNEVRSLFFNKVSNVPDPEKYFEYFKLIVLRSLSDSLVRIELFLYDWTSQF